MKLFIISIPISFFVLNYHFFEGRICYRNSYASKVKSVSSEQFNAMMGTSQKYYIKGNKYKFITNGILLEMQVYVPSENHIYTKLAISDTPRPRLRRGCHGQKQLHCGIGRLEAHALQERAWRILSEKNEWIRRIELKTQSH